MQDFTASLDRAFASDAQSAFWALRLYYNDEASFIGVSDKDRTLGGDIYYGSANWGAFDMELLMDAFQVREPAMKIEIINADNTIEGGRFSDLFTTKNFIGRKFELFQSDENADWSEDNILWTGIIGENIIHTHTSCSMNLKSYGLRQHKEIPLHRVNTTDYPTAPDENVGKPIPIWVGDFSIETGIPAGSDWERHMVLGHVPAIVTAMGDVNIDISILPDTDQAGLLHTLNTKNVYMYADGYYLSCEEANVTLVAAPAASAQNIIKFTGIDYYGLVQFASVTDQLKAVDPEKMIDGKFNTFGQIVFAVDEAGYVVWQFPKVPTMGVIADSDDIDILAVFDNFSTDEPDPIMAMVLPENTYFFIWGAGNEYGKAVLAAGSWSQADITAFNFEGKEAQLTISATPAVSVDIIMIAVQIMFKPDQTFRSTVKRVVPIGGHPYFPNKTAILDITEYEYPSDVFYFYVAGKGREYPSWIDEDARNNGFNEGDLLECPPYIIEEICRAEMELATAEINYAGFDSAGNTTDGDIENIFGLDAASIKMAFSQYQFTNSKKLIERICKESGLYFWFMHDGKATVRARRRTYTSVDREIDFNHIFPLSISSTYAEDIRNDVLVIYAKEYANDKFVKQRTSDDNASLKDATSQGNTVDGYGNIDGAVERKMTLEVHTNDSDTADGIGEAYIAYQKDTKKIISFNTNNARYNNLTIGDIINFSGWDANLPVFGIVPTTAHGWMVTKIQKYPNYSKIEVIRVPGEIA